MKRLQEQRVLAAAKRETDAHTQDMLNRSLANFHILATTAADPNLEQMLALQPLPLFPNQPMEIENPENQVEMHDFNPEEIPRVPAPNPSNPNYDPWWDDNRDYVQRYPIHEDLPMPNLGAYQGLDHLDPYYDNDVFIREILENSYPYQAPLPSYPGTRTPDSEPSPRTCTPNECRKRTRA
ncbi:hypothetical protein HanHA300_Chr14g0510381 [Helianthus annuus]|nr:hypothetical protein HanHA300_Chr14g0510381 [Helianthus annuus]KAJ0484365.1 hypothetical protein HanHA89_Chr14g0543321 [Helianthus annuus]